jgi:hypothetical protein
MLPALPTKPQAVTRPSSPGFAPEQMDARALIYALTCLEAAAKLCDEKGARECSLAIRTMAASADRPSAD